MSTPAGDDLIGGARIRVDADTDPAVRALRQFSRDADGRLRDVRGRFVSESALINRSLTNAAGGGDRFNLSLRNLTNIASRAGAILGRAGAGLGALGAAAGSAAPLLAGIVTTLENVAPAGAAAVTGMLAVTQASAAIKLGMIGVEDAVTAAFDSSKEGAKKFDAALKNLAPNARAFAVQVKALQPAFQKFQQGVQNRLFTGFADELKRLSSTVLPVVRTNLNTTALTLNRMGLGAASAARELAADGTLGKAMQGANQGLANLRTIPGQVVTALGQLAAAGSPALDRLTSGVRSVADTISARLTNAFKTGALESAVNGAIDLLKQLGTVASNIFGTLRNVIAPVQQAGGGLIGMLVQITGALKTASGTDAFRSAIASLANVMGTLARTVGPLVGQALASIAPIFIALGPPVQQLITELGAGLTPIITGLKPVLAAAATALGVLVDALSPLLPIVGDLIASLLPPLVPLLTAVGEVFRQAAPVVVLLGNALQSALAPVIAQLPAIINPVADILTMLAQDLFPILADTIVELSPSFTQLGTSFGQLLAAAGPLIAVLGKLVGQILVALGPLIPPIITVITQLTTVFTSQLATSITGVLVPALQALTALLNGDFAGAWRSLKTLVGGVVNYFTTTLSNLVGTVGSLVKMIVSPFQWLYNVLIGHSIIPDLVTGIAAWFGRLAGLVLGPLNSFRSTIVERFTSAVNWARGFPGMVASALSSLGSLIVGVASNAFARFRSAVVSGGTAAIAWVRGLPDRARSALGSLGGYLYNAGASLVSGFVDGIRDKIGDVIGAAKSVVSAARDYFPFSPAKKGPFSGRGYTLYSGHALAESLAAGMTQRAALVQKAAAGIAQAAQGAASLPAITDAAMSGTPMDVGAALGVGAMRTGSTAQTVSVVNNIYLENRGVLGSRRDVEDWLTEALDRLRLQGRLPLGGAA